VQKGGKKLEKLSSRGKVGKGRKKEESDTKKRSELFSRDDDSGAGEKEVWSPVGGGKERGGAENFSCVVARVREKYLTLQRHCLSRLKGKGVGILCGAKQKERNTHSHKKGYSKGG